MVNPDDINFVMQHAIEHAKKFNLDDKAVTFNLTKGVVKRIIPAIASTNACVSAACANEAFKIVTKTYHALENFTNYMGNEGCYSAPTKNELNPSCLVCGRSVLEVKFPYSKTLNDFAQYIKDDKQVFQFFTSPTLMWDDEDEEDHDFVYLYSPSAKCDRELLAAPLNQHFKDGWKVDLVHQEQKKNSKTGNMELGEIKTYKLQLRDQPLSNWLKEHSEFIDAWGSDIDKLAAKK